VTLHNWSLLHRAVSEGALGVGESYMDGDWESPDAGAFLELILVNTNVVRNYTNGPRGLFLLFEKFRHWLNAIRSAAPNATFPRTMISETPSIRNGLIPR
jgi:hypothetical protein